MAVAMSACLFVYVSVGVDYVGPDFVTRMGWVALRRGEARPAVSMNVCIRCCPSAHTPYVCLASMWHAEPKVSKHGTPVES